MESREWIARLGGGIRMLALCQIDSMRPCQILLHTPRLFHLRFCFGGGPEEERIEGDQRILIFRHGVILKTWVEDVEVEEFGIKVGAWMGAFLEHGQIHVTKDGGFENG